LRPIIVPIRIQKRFHLSSKIQFLSGVCCKKASISKNPPDRLRVRGEHGDVASHRFVQFDRVAEFSEIRELIQHKENVQAVDYEGHLFIRQITEPSRACRNGQSLLLAACENQLNQGIVLLERFIGSKERVHSSAAMDGTAVAKDLFVHWKVELPTAFRFV